MKRRESDESREAASPDTAMLRSRSVLPVFVTEICFLSEAPSTRVKVILLVDAEKLGWGHSMVALLPPPLPPLPPPPPPPADVVAPLGQDA